MQNLLWVTEKEITRHLWQLVAVLRNFSIILVIGLGLGIACTQTTQIPPTKTPDCSRVIYSIKVLDSTNLAQIANAEVQLSVSGTDQGTKHTDRVGDTFYNVEVNCSKVNGFLWVRADHYHPWGQNVNISVSDNLEDVRLTALNSMRNPPALEVVTNSTPTPSTLASQLQTITSVTIQPLQTTEFVVATSPVPPPTSIIAIQPTRVPPPVPTRTHILRPASTHTVTSVSITRTPIPQTYNAPRPYDPPDGATDRDRNTKLIWLSDNPLKEGEIFEVKVFTENQSEFIYPLAGIRPEQVAGLDGFRYVAQGHQFSKGVRYFWTVQTLRKTPSRPNGSRLLSH